MGVELVLLFCCFLLSRLLILLDGCYRRGEEGLIMLDNDGFDGLSAGRELFSHGVAE